MIRDYFVCSEEELNELIKRETPKHNKSPKIYMAGYSKFASWVYEDYTPDCDYHHESLYFIDYSDDGEDAVWDKFFKYTALKIFNEGKYEKLTIDRGEYHIDVCCDEFGHYTLDAFWHSAEMSEEEIEWLRGKDG